MTEANYSSNSVETRPASQIDLVLGQTAIMELRIPTRQFKFNGQLVETNLPMGSEDIFLPIDEKDYNGQGEEKYGYTYILERAIVPRNIDALPTGTFYVKGHDRDPNRLISIKDGPKGKVISEDALQSWPTISPEGYKLMAELGFIINDDSIDDNFIINDDGIDDEGQEVAYIPTPATLKKAAAELGVTVKFFDHQAVIDGKSYLETYAAGEHPVSTASPELYGHDIGDDHLTSLVLGGEPITRALQVAATNSLVKSDSTQDVLAIDQYTSLIGSLLRGQMKNVKGYDYYNGRQKLIDWGLKIGIEAETTNNIIETYRSNAAKFGIATIDFA